MLHLLLFLVQQRAKLQLFLHQLVVLLLQLIIIALLAGFFPDFARAQRRDLFLLLVKLSLQLTFVATQLLHFARIFLNLNLQGHLLMHDALVFFFLQAHLILRLLQLALQYAVLGCHAALILGGFEFLRHCLKSFLDLLVLIEYRV